MCGPLAAVAVIGVVGTAVSAYGQIQAGQAAKKSAQAQKASLTRQALEAEQRGEELAGRRAEQTKAQRARARVSLAASGLAVGEGTAGQVERDIATLGTKEEKLIRRSAARQALGLREKGAIVAFEGQQAQTAGFIGATGTVISGASTVASRWKPKGGGADAAGFGPMARSQA